MTARDASWRIWVGFRPHYSDFCAHMGACNSEMVSNTKTESNIKKRPVNSYRPLILLINAVLSHFDRFAAVQ